MSVSVTIRLPDEWAEKLDARCFMRKQRKTDVLMEAIERGWEEPAIAQRKTVVASQEEQKAPINIPGVFWGSELTARQEHEEEPSGDPEPVMCTYSEWSGELGETVYCGLPQHSAKIKHGRWQSTPNQPLAQ